MKTVRVADIAEQIRGVTFSKGDSVDEPRSGYLPVLTASNITEHGLKLDSVLYIPEVKVSSRQRLQKNDVLITASSGSLSVVGRAVLVRDQLDAGFGAFCKVLRPGPEVDPNYFAHFFRTPNYRAEVSRLAAGANINNLRNEDLDGFAFPLPPLPEQRRIADILDRADDLRAQRRRALELLRSMESAFFDVMFRDLAGDHVQLKDIVPADDRINYGVVQPGSETPGGVPIIRVGDLQGGLVRRTRLKHISAEIESAYSRSRLKGNEILVSCVGSIGEIAVAGPDDIGSNIARAVARVPVADDVERIYFATQLRSKRVQDYFVSELRTVSQPTLNIKQLAETEVVVATRAMQSEFASRVAKIEMLLKSHSEALARLDELFASLQHRAFQGEL